MVSLIQGLKVDCVRRCGHIIQQCVCEGGVPIVCEVGQSSVSTVLGRVQSDYLQRQTQSMYELYKSRLLAFRKGAGPAC